MSLDPEQLEFWEGQRDRPHDRASIVAATMEAGTGDGSSPSRRIRVEQVRSQLVRWSGILVR